MFRAPKISPVRREQLPGSIQQLVTSPPPPMPRSPTTQHHSVQRNNAGKSPCLKTEETGFYAMGVNATRATAVVVGGNVESVVLKVLFPYQWWLGSWRWMSVIDRAMSRTQNGHRGGEDH
jgi:hypothetical protein